MARVHLHDFLFCDICGTLLYFDSPVYASCPLCENKRDVNEFRGKEMWYKVGAEDIRKHLKLEPFIKVDNMEEVQEEDEIQQRAVVNEDCPKCHHPQLEYYTRQLRSADEGQTVFYECPNCRHKFAHNT
uniref:DNA-directed RNA polymerase subunit n=1 Tax=Araucaria cunninghamii TaxID=56994 RepID=A0A0D6R2Z3_ARACU